MSSVSHEPPENGQDQNIKNGVMFVDASLVSLTSTVGPMIYYAVEPKSVS